MKIFIGCDHAGFDYKEEVREFFASKGIEMEDMGCYENSRVDYPDFASKVAQAVQQNEGSRGVLICGTGIGVSICANKHKGIRAALCHTEFEAEMTRKHNDANIICVGSRTTGMSVVLRLIDVFLKEEFEGGRHAARVEKMNALDNA